MNETRWVVRRTTSLGVALTLIGLVGTTPQQDTPGSISMATRAVIEAYFAALKTGDGWQNQLADDIHFTSYTAPHRELSGKDAYVAGTRRFYGAVQSFALRQLLVDGDQAVALTTYDLRAPGNGSTFQSDVAEVFRVRDGKITVFDIYFDSAPFPK